ncbi:C2 domain-containing protein [Ooceraea biroi]|uniref:C2 domain-containing protein n=1 Tax=Ooceraea biroi TaxID=2015173 RepID=A0A026W9T5_OOCBI|nr:C2 domain-containing protein [Ooceraea biroi]
MDTEVRVCRSLPPLVEGKIHGSLKLIIDEVLWTKRSPGSITVVASWWGEHNSAQFRPIDCTTGVSRTNEDKIEIYTIKTNATLFEDYIKNCRTIELIIITEKTNEVIGAAHVDLSMIFEHKLSSQFVSILNDSGSKLGELRVSLQLTYLTKSQNIQKMCKYNKEQTDNDIVLSTIDNLKHREAIPYKNLDSIKESFMKSAKGDAYDTYRSVLKAKRPEFQEYKRKHDEAITDKLITQVVARAQRLRGAILKETYNEDPLALSDSSMSNESYPCTLVENEAKLYEYILGKEMTLLEKKQALDTLKLTSPTSSLIDLASKAITARESNNMDKLNENSSVKRNDPVKDTSRTHPLDYVDSIRTFIKSFTLSPAGYRRARSTCLQYGVPLSLTYLVQYDTTFGSARQDAKSNKEAKFTKICAKKQVGQVIDFNTEGVYNISREIISRNFPLKFKVLVRHLNHKLSTELGCGSININDVANTANLSSTQDVIITNKGIKIGELKVTVELGSDFLHFGKEFVDAVISAKENIPVLEIRSSLNTNGNRYRSITGTHSSKSSKVSSVSAKRIECLTNDNNQDLLIAKNMTEHQERSLDNRKVDTNNPESANKDKVLLHGLIYVAEGKDLPESNTYLICRAFWREDKATSQICSNTKNPFYHFFQLVPLIHGAELLERIRDNYIIIEVYSRQNGRTDNLLGIAKLPVHQLYVAYRDPLVLPHLLLSKYPVISVDDWVSINDPVNGKYCGELFALVALGTAEQIALLEVSRGLRNASIVSRSGYNYHRRVPDNTPNYAISVGDGSQCNIPEMPESLSAEQFPRDNFAYHVYGMPDRDLASVNYKTQESQTDISSLKDARSERSMQGTTCSEQLVLHALVDRLANALHVNKTSADQSAQTETSQADEAEAHGAGIRLNTLNSNSLTDDSDSCSPRNDFQLPTEMYRSVGVGAEYDDEEPNRQRNDACNNASDSSVTEGNTNGEETNISQNCDNFFFRAVVEIECALHLPKVEGLNDSVEPSTYVTFQDLIRKLDSSDRSSSHVVTNVVPRSCDPKWNWRCDVKLPTDLLLNNQKRLILKVWHLIDPDTSTIIDLEKDVVIGFSAIDLSVLMAGFPTVSGWFHIMDFTGKCNGQLKITITPLDSLLSLGKVAPNSVINLQNCSNLSQTNLPYVYSVPYNNTEARDAQQILPCTSFNKDKYVENECKQNDFVANVGHSLEDVSMSFLSLSLKRDYKTLTITFHDVTNAAFEDDFDNDFDMIEQSSDNENTDEKNVESPGPTVPAHSVNATSQVPKQHETEGDRNLADDDERRTSSIRSSNNDPHFQPTHSQKATSAEPPDTGYCSSSNTRFSQHPGHGEYNGHQVRRNGSTRNNLPDNVAEHPARGTKTHINHLLDKLSLDLPPRPPAGASVPMKKDILELFASLREHRNNWQDQNTNKNGLNVDTCSAVTQTENISERCSYPRATNLASTSDSGSDEHHVTKPLEQAQSRDKISTLIREELVADESSDSSNCDELTTYLITSNIRHMDLDILNPLLYQYLIPDLRVASAVSPESKAVEQLDKRYDTVTKSLDKMSLDDRTDRSTDNDASCRLDAQVKSRTNVFESAEESAKLFRLTPSGISANVDSNIDVAVVHKTSDNDLTSANSMESTATSLDKLSLEQVDAKTENHCSTMSELSVPGVSRQAPEGGNPVEEVKTSVATLSSQDDSQDVSVES